MWIAGVLAGNGKASSEQVKIQMPQKCVTATVLWVRSASLAWRGRRAETHQGHQLNSSNMRIDEPSTIHNTLLKKFFFFGRLVHFLELVQRQGGVGLLILLRALPRKCKAAPDKSLHVVLDTKQGNNSYRQDARSKRLPPLCLPSCPCPTRRLSRTET